jgi:hypothetical protein
LFGLCGVLNFSQNCGYSLLVENPKIPKLRFVEWRQTILLKKHFLLLSSASPNPSQANSKGQSYKKLYFTVAGTLTVLILIAALFIPPSSAVIPLEVNYTVGEQMVYDVNLAVSMEAPDIDLSPILGADSGNVTVNGTLTTDVLDFDGEFYTLNQTMQITLDDEPYSFSYLEKMNKTGYSTGFLNMEQQLTSLNASMGSPYLAQLLNQTEVQVGDKISVPIGEVLGSMGDSLIEYFPDANFTGNMTLTFGGEQELTVPAGTYNVFQIDMATDNVTYHMETPSIGNYSLIIDLGLDMTGQTYIEYGTMRPIQYTMQETLTMQSMGMEYTMSMDMNMTLVEHNMP